MATRGSRRTRKGARRRPSPPSVLTTDAAASAASAPIRYRVRMPDLASHELHGEMAVPALRDRATPDIVFPAWAPGSYRIRDFARHIYGLEVRGGGGGRGGGRAGAGGGGGRGGRLAVERIDKQRWRVASGGGAFVVRYRVFAFEATVRTSFLDASHAYWNGTSVFFY